MKKIISIILMLVVLLNYAYAAEDNSIISKTEEYSQGYFNDISVTDWYYENVISAYEYGVIAGMGDGSFNPGGNIKICEAIVIAVRIHNSVYNNIPISASTDLWYMPYVTYAESYGIISKGKFFGRYEDYATRAEFVYIMNNSVKDDELKNENPYSRTVPDMKPTEEYYKDILKAIKAGIISGKDTDGNFYPNDNITRAEASAVLNRIIERNERKSVMREINKEKEITHSFDKTEYYEENKKVLNYGNFNDIFSIYSGYLYYESIYCYLYNENQFNSYLDKIKTEGFQIIKSSSNSFLTRYEIRKGNKLIFVARIFWDYQQIWINVMWEDGFRVEKSNEAEVIEKNKWDKTNVYPESDVVKNYGANSGIGSISREMYSSEGKYIMKYKYVYSPADLVNYYTHLGYNTGYTLDLQSLDSNELFLDCTYKNRTTYVHIFVDLQEGTVTIEFPRTKIPEI